MMIADLARSHMDIIGMFLHRHGQGHYESLSTVIEVQNTGNA
jgi:hypothetical protein